MPPLTPQQQAENIVAGVKNAYRVVAIQHLHPNWVWWLSGVTLAFLGTMAYVANLSGEFNAGMAQETDYYNSSENEEWPPSHQLPLSPGTGDIWPPSHQLPLSPGTGDIWPPSHQLPLSPGTSY